MKTTIPFVAVVVPGLAAAVPPTLTHSGRLLDSFGAPLEGTHDLTVRLYDAATGGNVLWSDVVTTAVQDGYFSVALGDTANPIDASVVDVAAAWVEVQVGTGTPFPRQPLYSVPYAALADQVVGTSGTFTPVVELEGGNCRGQSVTATAAATGRYVRIGDLVHVTITDLPTGATHAYQCILRVTGLPFPAAEKTALSIGHARGVQFRYNVDVITDFTMSAKIEPGSTVIDTHTASSLSAYSGFWYLNGNSTGVYVTSISGTYIAAP